MEYARIPVDLLLDGTSDRVLVAIVKYQLLWAHLERQPAERVACRYLTVNQTEIVQDYIECISRIIIPDINSVVRKRGRDKKYYYKSKKKTDIPTVVTGDGTTVGSSYVQSSHIKEEDKIKKDKENKNIEYITKNGFNGIPIPALVVDLQEKSSYNKQC